MLTFFVENFGCRATQADAAAIRREFLVHGHAPAEIDSIADFVVLNTCTVTAAADAQARDAIRRIHRQNPSAQILVTGCYAQRAPDELAAIEGVALVIGNSHQSDIVPLVENRMGLVSISGPGRRDSATAPVIREDMSTIKEVLLAPPVPCEEHTRPILKVQDGCNHRCSYCVIPFVRGRSRSLEPDRVISEVRRLVDSGTQEIVLSGINLGSYGNDLTPRTTLLELVQRILCESDLERLRVSSIEPMDVTQDLVDLIASTDRVAPHFHMPLQSGSDRILRAMHRWYHTGHYARRVEIIHDQLPDAAIGADVITGFPGETEEDHISTMRFIDGLPFAYIHVFSFLPRPGTEADKFSADVPNDVIRRRARELRVLGMEKAKAFRVSQQGKPLRVLTLNHKNHDWTPAISGNFMKLRISGLWPRNRWMNVVWNGVDEPLPPISVGS